jgi:uncharacterized protein (TIGR02284 family)
MTKRVDANVVTSAHCRDARMPCPALQESHDVTDSSLVERLDALIRSCLDGERGFCRCAAQAQSLPLQWLLVQGAQLHQKAAAELQALRSAHAGDAPSAANPAPMPRGWVTPKSVLAGFSDLALLAESERGEDLTLQHYRRVLDEDLPIVMRAVAQRHADAAHNHRAQIRSLRTALLSAACEAPAPRTFVQRRQDAQAA